MPSRLNSATGGALGGDYFNSISGLIPLGFDLPVRCRFLLEIDGWEIGIFREVKGLEVSVEMDKIKEGGQNEYVHQVPVRLTWPNITFKRGLTMTDELFKWMQASAGEEFAGNGNKVTRYTGAITALDHTGIRLRTWTVRDAVPVKWRGPDFGVDEKSALEEELEIAHNGFDSETLPIKMPAMGMIPGVG